ncbi:uncharacterized protein LOC115737457 [Rhodamnia argentea]|uniref:Uncharacterized protein LOC115737457 n=1 Tax=Rhodamnia argentea TaxID=178133 RepID=A0A8B8NTB7_9MYRT|nr:uncharacterized protein LOC115737457 [Rhodamnia argentea]
MAPHGEAIVSSYSKSVGKALGAFSKPSRLSTDNLHRTKSDMMFELMKEEVAAPLPLISEVEDAKCECCGMSEECTPEYIERVRKRFSGRWICGLCAEAVKEEVEKNGGRRDEALATHMSACAKFKKIRAHPALFQASAMREILKKSTARTKSLSPRDGEGHKRVGTIARSSSCIPAITKDLNDLNLAN